MTTATISPITGAEAPPPAPPLTPPLIMRVGDRRYPVPSIEQASAMFCRARDSWLHSCSGQRAGDVPTPLIYDGTGRQVAYVSWNGKVWAGKPGGPFVPGRTPLCEAQG